MRNGVNGLASFARISGADMAVKTGTTTFGEGEAQKYNFDIDNYSKDSPSPNVVVPVLTAISAPLIRANEAVPFTTFLNIEVII